MTVISCYNCKRAIETKPSEHWEILMNCPVHRGSLQVCSMPPKHLCGVCKTAGILLLTHEHGKPKPVPPKGLIEIRYFPPLLLSAGCMLCGPPAAQGTAAATAAADAKDK